MAAEKEVAHDDENNFVTKHELAQLLRAQEQAFTVLVRAVGAVIGEDRLADALAGRLASLHAADHDGDDQLFAAALLSRALQDLRAAHLPGSKAVAYDDDQGTE